MKMYHTSSVYKKAEMSVFLSDKVDFKIKNTPNKICHFIMINENVIIINV